MIRQRFELYPENLPITLTDRQAALLEIEG